MHLSEPFYRYVKVHSLNGGDDAANHEAMKVLITTDNSAGVFFRNNMNLTEEYSWKCLYLPH